MAVPTLTANTPVAGSISWTAFTIRYAGASFGVNAGSTSQKYVWWRYNGGVGSVIEAGAGIPTNLVDDDLVLFANKNGIPVNVQSVNVVDGGLLVNGSVVADAIGANEIKSVHIDTDAVTARNVNSEIIIADETYSQEGYFGAIRADQLEAGDGIINELEVKGGLTIDKMRWNPREGLVLDHPDGRQTYIRADGTGSRFVGDGILDYLTVLKGLNLSGNDMRISGVLRAQAGISKPGQPLAVASDYPFYDPGWKDAVDAGSGISTYYAGLTDNSGGNLYLAGAYGNYGGWYSQIQWREKAGTLAYVQAALPTGWVGSGGTTRIGTTYYVLACARNMSTGVIDYSNWRVFKVPESGGAITSFNVTPHTAAANRLPAIGTDGTNLLIALATPTNGLYLRTALPSRTADLDATGQLTLVATGGWASGVAGIIRTSTGMTGDRYVVASNGSYAYAFSTGGGRIAGDDFPLATNNCRGMFIDANDGNTIKTLHTDGKIYRYTSLTGTWDLAHAWVGTDRGSGAAETDATVVRVTPKRFARWTVVLSEAPPSGDPAFPALGANTANIYAGPAGGVLKLQTTLPVTTPATLSQVYTTAWTTTGKTPEVTNGFATRPGGIGVFESFQKDVQGVNPSWQFQGNGVGRIGPWKADKDGYGTQDNFAVASTGNASPTSTTNVTVPGMSITVASPGPGAIWQVILSLDTSLNAAGTNTTELLVDGVVYGNAMFFGGANGQRAMNCKPWRVTGLAAGNHTFTVRTRSNGAYTTNVISGTSTMSVLRTS